jgi:hypothetical protein
MIEIERETRAVASICFPADEVTGSYAEAVRMREDMGQLGTDTSTSTLNIFCDPWAIFAWFTGCTAFLGRTGRELTLDEGSVEAGSPSAMDARSGNDGVIKLPRLTSFLTSLFFIIIP